jgi:flagellar motor switch protein FliM
MSKKVVKEFDLTNPNIKLNYDFPGLDFVHEKFAYQFRIVLSKFLKETVEVKSTTPEVVKFSQFINAIDSPSFLAVGKLGLNLGPFILEVNHQLGYQIIEHSLGGADQKVDFSLSEQKEITAIEFSVVRKIMNLFLSEYKKEWSSMAAIDPMITQEESCSNFINILPPTDNVYISVFSVNGGKFDGEFRLVLPLSTLRVFKE